MADMDRLLQVLEKWLQQLIYEFYRQNIKVGISYQLGSIE